MRTAIVLVLVATVTSCVDSNNLQANSADGGNADVIALQGRIATLEATVKDLQDAVSKLQAMSTPDAGGSTVDVNALQQQVATLDSKQQALEARLNAVKVDDLVSGANTDLGRLHGRNVTTMDVDGARLMLEVRLNTIRWSGLNCTGNPHIGNPYGDSFTADGLATPYQAYLGPDGQVYTIAQRSTVVDLQSFQSTDLNTFQARCTNQSQPQTTIMALAASKKKLAIDWTSFRIVEQ